MSTVISVYPAERLVALTGVFTRYISNCADQEILLVRLAVGLKYSSELLVRYHLAPETITIHAIYYHAKNSVI